MYKQTKAFADKKKIQFKNLILFLQYKYQT